MMATIITILAIIGGITVLCLFCVAAFLVATHLAYTWRSQPFREVRGESQGSRYKVSGIKQRRGKKKRRRK